MSLVRTLRTIRYLRPRQLVGQLQVRSLKICGRWWHTKLAEAPAFPGLRGSSSAPTLPPGAQKNRQENLTRGVFEFLNREENLGWPPEWNSKELPKLWQYNLHYFEYLWALDFASAKSIVEDWIQRHTYRSDATGWEPYPISLRLQNWCGYFFGRHRDQIEQDKEFTSVLWKSVYQQTELLCNRLEYHLLGNHLLENAATLVLAGMTFPGSDADRWREIGLTILRREICEQMLADGGHFERSPMYHARVTYLLASLFATGDHKVREVIEEPLERAIKAGELLTIEDGKLALLNDSAWETYNTIEEVRAFAAAAGASISTGQTGNFALSDSGYYGYTSAVGTGIICDAGSIGPDYIPGHAHGDIFSFEFCLRHQRVIVDSGVFDYEENQMRRYCRSTAAHNTLEIDGQDQSEFWGAFRVARRGKPFDVLWEPLADGFRLKGSHDGYSRLNGEPIHQRLFRWRSDGILMIQDLVTSSTPHQIVCRFHVHPQCAVTRISAERFEIESSTGRLSLLATQCREAEIEDSWFCPKFGVRIPNKAIAFRMSGRTARAGFCFVQHAGAATLDVDEGLVLNAHKYSW